MPGQPFYIREMTYWRVKDFMVSKGVRLNDFSIVQRRNRYFDHPKGKEGEGIAHGVVEKEDIKLSPAGPFGLWGVDSWVTACSIIGMPAFILFDQWVSLAFIQRLWHKYIIKDVK
jgi:hypothetical protein